jgi:enoyl-CoA hydratase
MEYEHLLLREQGDALWVTLNRPQSLNALNARMTTELRHLFTDLYDRRNVRAVVITGAGPVFCAGLDLKEASGSQAAPDVEQLLDRQRRNADIVLAMRRCPQPIVALLNGPATGGGFALALAADVRIAVPAARMNAAFIRVGLTACDMGVSYFLPRMVGVSVAAEYLLTGRFIDAERAQSLGLINRVVDAGQLAAEGQAFVDDMLRATPLALRLTKEALSHAVDAQGLEAVLAMEDRNQILAASGPDFREGVMAFLEKRQARFGRFSPAQTEERK